MLTDGLMKEAEDSPPSNSRITLRSLCASSQRRILIGSLVVVGLVVVLGLAITGHFTQWQSTPSIGDSSGSSWVTVDGNSLVLSYIDWRSNSNGTYVVIMDDADSAGHWEHGHTSSESPYSVGEGGAYVEEGNAKVTLYEYTYSTLDGAKVDFFVDGTQYDLSQGSVFLITTYNVSPVQIQQLALDLGSVDFYHDKETLQNLLSQNEDIVAFVERKASHSNDDV